KGGRCPCRPNGAALIGSLGQRPRMDEEKRTSAESAIHSGIESRLQRFLDVRLENPGVLPQANLTRAPLARKRCGRILSFLICVLMIALAGASFAQEEEREEEASNAKPDAGGVV